MQRLKLRFVKLFLPSGPSWPMAPLFILLESISYSFRAISLGVRLWRNLLSGHMLLHLF
jgi:F-type H+-transporting ATPase subunit a